MAGIWLLMETRERTLVLDKWSGEILWVGPVFWWLLVQGVLLCVFTASRWSGDPATRLLLKLFDDEEAKS